MPVTLPRLIIWGRRVLSARASLSEIPTPFKMLLHRRNRGTDCISSLIGSSSWCCPEGIRRRKNSSAEISSGTAKAWSAKIKASMVMWGQSSKHGSFGTSGIPNSFLRQSLAKTPSRCMAAKGYGRRYLRVFLAKIAFRILVCDFHQYSGPFSSLGIREQSDLDVSIADR